jgi:single-strand DNA-binding protein
MAARSLNKVQLIGNLTREPEVRFTGNGTAVATFGIATNRSWKDAEGEVKEAVEFHNIVAWGKLAEICEQLLHKGGKVYIEGSLTTRSWDDEESGKKMYRTEVRLSEMILLDSKGKGGSGDDSTTDDTPMPEEEESESGSKDEGDPLEDLPF